MQFHSQNSKKGFTLAEMLMAMTVGSFMLATSWACIMALAKGSESMINFGEMNSQTRLTLEFFGRDSRMAHEVTISTEKEFGFRRNIQGVEHEVQYEYIPSAGTFVRREYNVDPVTGVLDLDVTRTFLFDVQELYFEFYTLRHNTTTNPIEVKHVQLEAELQRKVLNITNTNYIISARFMMRNRDVSN